MPARQGKERKERMAVSLLEKEREIEERIDLLGDSFSQCDYLMMKGLDRKELPEIREDRFRISGCKTAIWADAELSGNKVIFRADSDSLLVKGVLALFDEVYAGAGAEEAAGCPPLFVEHISEDVIYREIKDNGLQKCYGKIRALRNSLHRSETGAEMK